MSTLPQRAPRGARRRVEAWAAQHLQCAVASLGTLCRAPLASLLTAAVIGVALALPLSAYLVIRGMADVSARFANSGDISLFLRPEVALSRARRLAAELSARADVAAVEVIGKEQGLVEFRSALGMVSGLDALGGANPLPVVVVVRPRSVQEPAVEGLLDALSKLPEGEFVQVDRHWLARLQAILDIAHRVLWLLAGLLGAGVVLVIGNTLRMSIEARRSEIEIAKLFGASDAFVRRPFLYHGLFYGLAGALVACALVLLAALTLHGPVQRLGAEYAGQLELSVPGPPHLATLLAVGSVLGLLGAWLSVGRHLRAVEPR